MNLMHTRALISSSYFCIAIAAMGCGKEPCKGSVSNFTISNGPNALGAVTAEVCPSASPDGRLELHFKQGVWQNVELNVFPDGDNGDNLGPIGPGTYACTESQVKVILNDVEEDGYEYTYRHFEAGQPPGPLSMVDGGTCTLELESGFAADTVSGSFNGHLARQKIDGITYEFIDVAFQFSAPVF